MVWNYIKNLKLGILMKKTQILFILFLIADSIFAQTPFISNFSPEEYKISGQNWDIVQSKQGIMYFANNYGVLMVQIGDVLLLQHVQDPCALTALVLFMLDWRQILAIYNLIVLED